MTDKQKQLVLQIESLCMELKDTLHNKDNMCISIFAHATYFNLRSDCRDKEIDYTTVNGRVVKL